MLTDVNLKVEIVKDNNKFYEFLKSQSGLKTFKMLRGMTLSLLINLQSAKFLKCF